MDYTQIRSFSPEASNDSGISSNFSLPRNMELNEAEALVENENSFLRHVDEEKTLSQIDAEGRHKTLVNLLEKASLFTELMTPRLKKAKDVEMKRIQKLETHKAGKFNSKVRRSGRCVKTSKEDSVYFYENDFPSENKNKKRSKESSSTCAIRKKTKVDYSNAVVESLSEINENPIGNVEALDLRFFTGGELRDYQLDGLLWLKARFEQGINGILADEMGLGKTVQVIALFAHFYAKNLNGPFFVVAPLSTLPNWRSEFKRFAPQIPVVLYHGDKNIRKERLSAINREYELKGIHHTIQPVVLTSYQIALHDRSALSKLNWVYLVIDEGHRIKNNDCLLKRALTGLNANNRLLLTGTPLQNNLDELWSLLNFLLPDLFSDLKWFHSMFDFTAVHDVDGASKIIAQEKEQQILSKLHMIITPFILRRVKSDVEIELPPKKEIWVYAPLSQSQVELYKAAVEKCILVFFKKQENNKVVEIKGKRRSLLRPETLVEEEIKKKTPSDNVELNTKSLRSMMMTLREICIHPYLLEYPLLNNGEYKMDQDLLRKSGKMAVFDRLLMALLKRKHKVLVFSQFCKALNLIEDLFYLRKIKYCRLDGSMDLDSREHEIKRFTDNPNYPVFLISTKAGGLGLNLVAADTVIIFDSDWNPQGDLQAQDRCHRIGQSKPVAVYRLICRGTIDEEIVKRATAKRRLEKMVIHNGNFKFENNQKDKRITPDELLKLLNSCDYSTCLETDLTNDKIISDNDLKALLDRSEYTTDNKDNNECLAVDNKEGSCFEVVSVDMTSELIV